MSKRIFVSYSRRDLKSVILYVEALTKRGVLTWIDQTGIGGATEWSAEIVDAIGSADLVLLMCSESSVNSKNVAREIALAAEEGKPLLPVFLEKGAKICSSLRYHMAGIQHIDASARDVESVANEIIRALEALSPAATAATSDAPKEASVAPPRVEKVATWKPEVLAKVEAHLALSVGPIAKVLVRKTSRAQSDWDPFTHALSEQIPTEEEKAEFLAFCRTLRT